jgi:hypothetical protein
MVTTALIGIPVAALLVNLAELLLKVDDQTCNTFCRHRIGRRAADKLAVLHDLHFEFNALVFGMHRLHRMDVAGHYELSVTINAEGDAVMETYTIYVRFPTYGTLFKPRPLLGLPCASRHDRSACIHTSFYCRTTIRTFSSRTSGRAVWLAA